MYKCFSRLVNIPNFNNITYIFEYFETTSTPSQSLYLERLQFRTISINFPLDSRKYFHSGARIIKRNFELRKLFLRALRMHL